MNRQFLISVVIIIISFSVSILRGFLLVEKPFPANHFYAVVDDVVVREKGKQFVIVQPTEHAAPVRLITNLYPRYQYGDLLAIHGGAGDWRYYPSIKIISTDNGSVVKKFVSTIRSALITQTESLFTEPYASFVLGLVFGLDRDLGSYTELVKRAGLQHLLVASGYNVSLIIGAFALLKPWIGKSLVVVGTFIAVILFSLIAGFEPPIVRASIMGGASIIALAWGLQKHAYLWLMYAATLMILVHPLIVESLSFWLSFTATFSLVVIEPLITRLTKILPGFIAADVTATIAVSILIYPLLYFTVGTVTLIGLIANILVLWCIPVITITSLLALCFGVVAPMVGHVVVVVPQTFLSYVMWVLQNVS